MTTADEILVRRAPAGRTSWDPETRTLELVVSTFADYRRYGFVERLSRAAADWDLSRVSAPGGVPFLDGHNTWSSEARLGRVQSISIGKDGVRAVVKLNTSPGADALIREIEGGTPPGISFGYSVGRWQLADDDAKEIRIAKEICIFEVSAVSVAADPGAHIRTKEASMPNPRNTRYTPVPTAPANSAPPAEQESRDLDPVEAERNRVSEINALGRRLKINPFMVDRAIRAGTSVEKFRAAVLDAMAEDQDDTDIRSHAQPDGYYQHHSLESPATFRRAAAEALLDRIHGRDSTGIAAAVFADGEVAFARRLLQNAGSDCRGWSDQRVLRSYLTTSDFNLIAGMVANTRIVETYKAAVSPISTVFGKRHVPDFNKHTEALVDWTTLKIEKVNEHGEYHSSFIDEAGETISIATYGTITAITRQLLVNAHGALDNMAKKQGLALAAWRATQMVRFIEQNSYAGPKLRDNTAVFHASRENIKTLPTYDPKVAGTELMLQRSRQARRKGGGDVIIGTMPKFWLVHSDLEGFAFQVLANVAATEVSNVNPVAGRLTVVPEPRLTDPSKSWLLADPNEMDGAVQVAMEGAEDPFTDSWEGKEIDGISFKIRLDHGLGWLEWRSWTRLDHDSTPLEPNPD